LKSTSKTKNFEELRNNMVRHQLEGRDITDQLVLNAMRKVPRHLFVASHLANLAYNDYPLSIGCQQTISQPYIVAMMIQALNLKGDEKVLEIGTGSGYAAAVLAQIVSEVFTIERVGELAERAKKTLKQLRFKNVHVKCGDGTLGWPEAAPYDGIVVTAGGPKVPHALKEQLTIGGILVIPVEREYIGQDLIRLTRLNETSYETDNLGGVRFVRLIGEQGWGHERFYL